MTLWNLDCLGFLCTSMTVAFRQSYTRGGDWIVQRGQGSRVPQVTSQPANHLLSPHPLPTCAVLENKFNSYALSQGEDRRTTRVVHTYGQGPESD
ncbi:hypothetical protein GGR54DRAFT_99655 [Hypoxylon sp. NC1633]|nr:hypothetical protein GGR54DRAFT_99655 [Hypoxylon sp. NC1633]